MSPIQTLQDIDILLVDAFSLLFRAFHSFPLHLTTKDGELTNAVYGFTRLLLDALRKTNPEYVVVAVDMGKPTFRHEAFAAYKANREEAPQELTAQIGRLYQVLQVMNIPTLGVEGYEADDVIGTLVQRLRVDYPQMRIGVLTGDRDAYQLVDDRVVILQPPRQSKGGIDLVDADEVQARMGVRPDQIVDYKALCGDSSDNIPGVKGVGPKTAVALLGQFQSLTALYQALHAGQLEGVTPGVQAKLLAGESSADISQQLATIDRMVPVAFTLESARLNDYDKAATLALFQELGFSSLQKLLPNDSFESAVQASLF